MISKARPLTSIGIERNGHGLGGEIRQLTTVEVLAHALVDARSARCR